MNDFPQITLKLKTIQIHNNLMIEDNNNLNIIDRLYQKM